MTNEQHQAKYGRQLDVHRLAPGSVYSVAGCVTLCKPCHGPEPKLPPGTNRSQLNVRMDDEMKELFAALLPKAADATGLNVSQSDVVRLAPRALAEKYGVRPPEKPPRGGG